MKKILCLIGSLLLMSGCAAVVTLPASTGEMPVVGGDFLKGRVGYDVSNAIPVTVVNDITSTPPTRDHIAVPDYLERDQQQRNHHQRFQI